MSTLPVRRTTRSRNVDENSTSTTNNLNRKVSTSTISTKAPTTKKTTTVENSTVLDGKRKRNALGDLTRTHANNDKSSTITTRDVNGKLVNKKPSTGLGKVDPTTTKRTTRSASNSSKPVDEGVPIDPTKRRVAKPATTQVKSKVGRPTTKKPTNVKQSQVEDEMDYVDEPDVKRQRTSSPGDELLLEAQRFEADEERRRLAKAKQNLPAADEGWEDLDAEDEGDPLMVSEYVVEIFEYMKVLEQQTMPNPNYMDNQKELRWRMRGVLVDWLIEIHHKFRLLPETLFLAINIVDRFLSLRIVSIIKLQLVGLTAMLIAAKYEEVMCPTVANVVYMSDGGYEESELLKAEQYVLQILSWDLSYPNPIHFLRRVSKADDYDIETRTLAKYFMEISCVEEKLLRFPPSQIAAAATYLSRMCLDRGEWSANLVHYSGYSVLELLPCAQVMLDYVKSKDIKHDAFYRKYASKKFLKASTFVREWALGLYGPDGQANLEAEYRQECEDQGIQPR
ncbi:G2/M-specific cyclin NimE [Wallemia mellicola]|uniref:G2/M-specific cyclin NimE n=2 Tax=Wallemia mellicola TaxID=1708541 RepID=A0A4T0S4G1_9BASI|nr:G2/M-specific cyclin NimE [Wallemia mellicola CBS 633.66]TIB78193.1 hypothetical protein E3Q23_00824 [Wallemia mellicola]EIM23191.1 G2/M-specific cyclin NimE [Wallemia mellicola CBS 633.66]TIB82467.1 G2/M-specific cyclin NimE [Wallemia mellicola]TIB84875.1 G2/M-specific cyclin NimE [Wallemia mellicola]TIB88123.1 G2/M-specific cyclin NimE [Wallemia mellicola]|eukprot:XP_006956585.1 G2/M-specific cyclin NimE [Wallemia mellicola CBS 633.66]